MTESSAKSETPSASSGVDLNTIVSLCKRRGFIFQSSEIYGGLGSTWDYGPLGVELKRNVKDAWWRAFVLERDDMVGLDASILMHPDVWRASGHVDSFADPLVECRNCHHRFRLDEIIVGEGTTESHAQIMFSSVGGTEAEVRAELTDRAARIGSPLTEVRILPLVGPDRTGPISYIPCPACDVMETLTEPRMFNLMFKTFMGPVEDDASVAYLRPETAQGIFVNFNNVLTATRRKLPFGIAQIGKAFRNEITTGNFIFRTREFEMMEIEYFVKPDQSDESYREWIEEARRWYGALGVEDARLRVRPHDEKELSHYSRATSDIEYQFPWGWGEIQGIANRTDYDLKAHSESSGEELTYFDEETGQHITPYVVEPSAGVDRAVMTFLVDAYEEEEAQAASGKMERRVVLRLHPTLAPVKVAVLPLSRNERLVPLARQVYDTVRRSGGVRGLTQYDDAQSIGRRYRRQDEIGTPVCVTVDFDSLDDNAVTIRERDTMAQVRVPIAELLLELKTRLDV